jgi:hypothetical protein
MARIESLKSFLRKLKLQVWMSEQDKTQALAIIELAEEDLMGLDQWCIQYQLTTISYWI